uniref:F-box domain-containing protein n=1 Tax=Moniliophthora roreri TaxID=221103 RepID=A0A0W0F886_MONRR
MSELKIRCTKSPLSPDELQQRLRLHDALSRDHLPLLEINQFISDTRHDIDAYEEHIYRLLSSVRQYRAKQVSLRRDIARYQSLLSPIRRIPSEVLQQIFTFAATPTLLGANSWTSPAFIMASVCVRWRNVALQSPVIWSKISAGLCSRSAFPLKLCILRSSQHPLTLALYYHLATGNDEGIVREQLRSIFRHSDRLAGLQFGFSVRLDTSWEELKQLTQLPRLRLSSCGPKDALNSVNFLLKKAPLLESFTMPGHFTELPEDFPVLNIRHLVLIHGNNTSLRPLLNQVNTCKRLSSLLINSNFSIVANENGFLEPYKDYSYTDISVSSNIISLSVDMWAKDGIYLILGDLFQVLTLPLLRTLSIRGGSHPDQPAFTHSWPGATFSSLISRSNCDLTTVELSGLPLTDSEVIAFLSHTPCLEDLALHEQWVSLSSARGFEIPPTKPRNPTITKRLCEHLTWSSLDEDVFASNQELLLAKLKRLRFRVWRHFDADSEFVEMVMSRWDLLTDEDVAAEKLREVELRVVYMEEDLDATIYKPLKQLDKGGLMVTVVGNDKSSIRITAVVVSVTSP